jgi:hypothetical protein
MKTKFKLLLLGFFVNILFAAYSYAQDVPLVYDVENTGVGFPQPVLPSVDELPIVRPLTDPFEWSDGSGRDTTFASWSHRRAEIKAEIENYEIGLKPLRPDTITASYADDTLTVNITENGQTLTLTSKITLPAGNGPFPAIIGIAAGTGSLPADIFTTRNVAQIPFNFGQVMAHTQTRGKEPINKLYPELIHMGAYSAWSWGISRLIDGLELVADSLPIDMSRLAVSGCSFAGKMALFAGAFDERIALTIAQESGGGGAAAWRVSETVGAVETLGATSHVWFMESMFKFQGANTAKLPYDHHELMAMVAPRALLVLGNPDFVWLADESGYVSCRAAHEVWKKFGVANRFGFSIAGGHGHCALPDFQKPEVEAFVEKFLLGDESANTDVAIHPYADVNYKRWFEWWGKGESYFPEQFVGVTKTLEAECGTLGANWTKATDEEASNEAYVVAKQGFEYPTKDDINEAGLINIPFSLDSAGNFSLHARVNCPSSSSDSFWFRIDDGTYYLRMGLVTTGWEWKKLGEFELEGGDHTISFGYRENGGKLDKICFSSYLFYEPTEIGDEAKNVCDPAVGMNLIESVNGFTLGQNYPNPFNGKTTISFEILENTYVSLKVYNSFGVEIEELAASEFKAGEHVVDFDIKNLANGIYFYTIKSNNFSASRKMILDGK